MDKCRLCFNSNNLNCIFVNTAQCERYSVVLALTTGLKIKLDDGLPQKICTTCVNLVNSSLQLRNQSHRTEIKLVKMGFKRKQHENINKNIDIDKQINEKIGNFNENTQDYFDFDGFKIEVELDRISENGGVSQDSVERTNLTKEKIIRPVRSIKKEKRQTYLDLVEGKYDPKKPVKCRICKKTVSKWACFINHAKKHLGFKFVCEYCGKSFISLNQLKRHCRSYHGMARDIKCRHCSYLALDNSQLVVHERRMHTGERPYVCDICAASYFSRKCLVQHIECHRTVASIQCDKCPLLFKSQRHLSKHKYGAHGEKRRARRRLQRALLKNQHADT